MKWVLLVIIAIVVFAIFRRMNRDAGSQPMPHFWQQRPELPFDDFYAQYYSDTGLDREFVRSALQMVAHATSVPANRLRPDDRIDDLKPGALNTAIALLKRIDSTGLLENAGLPHPQNWNIETVDAVIKFLAPYYKRESE